jgi:F0F1-type ATP synthase assembly protein I
MNDGDEGPVGQKGKKSGGRPEGTDSSFSAGYQGAGIQFGLSIVLFTLGGVWLDSKFATSPWLTLLGVLVGAVGGFMALYTRIAADVKRDDELRKRRKGEGK